MKRMFILNGRPTSGKDEFVMIAMRLFKKQFIYNESTVDEIKRIAYKMGWDGEKTDKSRKFLSDLKDLSTEFNDGPYNHIKWAWEHTPDGSFMFVHSREIPEIKRFQKDFNAVTLWIDRPSDKIYGNYADDEGFDVDTYDHIIENHGDLNDYKEIVETFMNKVFHGVI